MKATPPSPLRSHRASVHRRPNARQVVRAALLVISGLLSGCGLLNPPPTPAPIIITATPERVEPSATPSPLPSTPSPVVAPRAGITLSPRAFPTATRTPLPSRVPSRTPTFTPSPTDTPVTPGAAALPLGGLAGAFPASSGPCVAVPGGGFAAIYARDAALQAALGCALGTAVSVSGAIQDFESGRMLWSAQYGDIPGGVIYALLSAGISMRVQDTWIEGVDPVAAPGVGETPPDGRIAPERGFGKAWGLTPAIRSSLGWALARESATSLVIQRFERGEMVFVGTLGQTYIVINALSGSTWRLDPTPF